MTTQPKQEQRSDSEQLGEPVAWWVTSPDGELDDSDGPIKNKEERPLDELIEGCGYAPLYTTPYVPTQKKPWVGLTESDRRLINYQWKVGNGTTIEIIDLIEATLKEKNT